MSYLLVRASLQRVDLNLRLGAQQLDENGNALEEGANSLAEGLPQIQDGLHSLNGGLNDLADGAGQLNDGAHELKDGSVQLVDGSQELADKLAEGAEEVRDIHSEDDNAGMFSAPTELSETQVSELPNYGYGMAPYMMSVALFIGAVIYCLLFPIKEPAEYPTSGIKWWLSKFSIHFLVSLLQASVLVAVMVWIVGLEPQSVGATLLVALVTSIAFMALIQFFNILFGPPGSFMMLILMIFQLGGAGGTFPIQLSNGFFQAIHPFLPMTYSIDAYRQAITLGGSMVSDLLVLAGIFVVFTVVPLHILL
ncbi:YhgE/Pip family protein [Alkalicoccobacillus plakortidis]|uniref:YhgE/Pip family protein n=1 Tax=Alkalicoccobacillus plakortidis TaxID=444060 RepID=A0ABT0XMY9_9BACI|nr:YhgE/Pip family protein [Alkalicoccobacillus plakortidis]MCM2677269.1 YhgE/Pip family protein [Alkalicoccobacillus plakortidis]